MKKLSIGILGGGAVTRIFYLPAFQLLGEKVHLQLRCIVDTSSYSLDKIKLLNSNTKLVNAPFERFLMDNQEKQELEAVIVALPHHLHEAAVCQSLDSGLHVLCEKPVALDVGSLQRMIRAAEQSGKVFGGCHIRRHYPAVQAIREIIESRMFGSCRKIMWMEGSRYDWPSESLSQVKHEHGGEELFDIGSHVFDLLCWWLGELEVISYNDDSKGGAGADFHIGLQSMRGTEVKVRLSRIAELTQTVTIQFEEGTIKWRLSESNNIYVTSSRFPLGKGKVTFGTKPDSLIDLFVKELITFGKAIEGDGLPTVTGKEAALYVSVFDQCNNLRASKKPVKVEDNMSWPWDNRNIAVTGASGFIGCRLVEIAMERGFNVHALVHQPKNCVRLARNDVQMSVCDIMNPESLNMHTRGVSAVFHCAYGLGNNQIMHDTIIKGTKNILSAAVENDIEVAVIMSSMLAYGDPPSFGTIHENTLASPSNTIYGKFKAEMERICLHFASKHPLRIVILEPTCVFGPWSNGFVTDPVWKMRNNEFFVIEKGQGTANMLYVDNLVDAMLLSATEDVPLRSRFIVNEEEWNGTWGEYYSELSKAIGIPDDFTSFSINDFNNILTQRKKERSFPNVFRSAIIRDPITREWLSKNLFFKGWHHLKHSIFSALQSNHSNSCSKGIQMRDSTSQLRKQFLDKDKFYYDEHFLKFYNTRTIYRSDKIRKQLGWTPKIDRHSAFQKTSRWIRRYLIPELSDTDVG
jgi:nucleoside-diphosphate-sugar epimerase/predicted dehydrogenase